MQPHTYYIDVHCIMYIRTSLIRTPRGPIQCVLIREVSSFQGENNTCIYLYEVRTWSSVLSREVSLINSGVPLYTAHKHPIHTCIHATAYASCTLSHTTQSAHSHGCMHNSVHSLTELQSVLKVKIGRVCPADELRQSGGCN